MYELIIDIGITGKLMLIQEQHNASQPSAHVFSVNVVNDFYGGPLHSNPYERRDVGNRRHYQPKGHLQGRSRTRRKSCCHKQDQCGRISVSFTTCSIRDKQTLTQPQAILANSQQIRLSYPSLQRQHLPQHS